MLYPKPLPMWIDHALRHEGLKEIPGKAHNPTILKWLTQLKAWWKEDETPWCGTFIAHCLRESGLPIPQHWYRAKAYGEFGTPCPRTDIPFGAICVKSRQGGGHVFFAVAKSPDGKIIYGLGGNQRNMVNITAFNISDIDNIRWPVNGGTFRHPLPVASSIAAIGAHGAGGGEA